MALSGLGQEEDKARAAAAGFARHFTKPVDVNALRSFLATVEPGGGVNPASSDADEPRLRQRNCRRRVNG